METGKSRITKCSRALTVALAASMIFTACGAPASSAASGTESASSSTADPTAKESPMLAEMVSAGEIPSLEERLPEQPYVAKMGSIDAVYGGELRLAFKGDDCAEYGWLNGGVARVLQQDSIGDKETLPYANTVESYDINDDYTEYTFHMRKGMKWSDGEPLTTEDVRFWWEDVILNSEITPSLDSMWLSPKGAQMELSILDEYTFVCKFADSNMMFPWHLSLDWRNNTMFFLPSHYLKNLHKDYADPEQFKKDLAANGYSEEDWGQYFTAFGWGPDGPDKITTSKPGCPVLTPYYKAEQVSPTVWIMKRNPYFFQVDEAGRQLPYIDTIRVEQVTETSMLTMKAMAGEIDYLREAISTLDVPVLKESESTGNYTTVTVPHPSVPFLTFNCGYEKDPAIAEIFNTREFRQALNYAIPREEILENLYLGQAKLSYHVPGEYSVEKANALLDQIGMDKRDSEGFRLRPDGTPFTIDFQYAKYGTNFGEMVEIIRQGWAEVGIRLLPKEVDVSLEGQLFSSNEYQIRMLWADPAVYEKNPTMWYKNTDYQNSPRYLTYYSR